MVYYPLTYLTFLGSKIHFLFLIRNLSLKVFWLKLGFIFFDYVKQSHVMMSLDDDVACWIFIISLFLFEICEMMNQIISKISVTCLKSGLINGIYCKRYEISLLVFPWPYDEKSMLFSIFMLKARNWLSRNESLIFGG